ncbi:hypothetical protein KA005_00275 [bacterium]|nr:hypothetical protein [bacterium]
MNKMTAKEKQKIVGILSKKGAVHPCPRCGEKGFTLLDGYFNQTIQQTLGGGNTFIGGPSVPSIVVVCNNCGYMSQHALGVLGLMPENGDAK